MADKSAAVGGMGKLKGVEKPPLADHDSSVLDLVFAMDCTGSMGSYIRDAQQNIRIIVEKIVAAEKSNVQLALVQYRDHPPQDSSFVTKVNDFTGSVNEMKKWLDSCSADGGGDTPEAVADALQQVLKLSWRPEATKICVFIADAPPHGLIKAGDGFPKGCPEGLDPVNITYQLAEKGVTIYMVGCEPSIRKSRDFFMALAHITGGQYVPLKNSAMLSSVIIGGAQEEISLERLMEEVNEEVEQEFATYAGTIPDEEELSKRVHGKLKTKGYMAKQLQYQSSALPEASSFAKHISDLPTKNLEAWSEVYHKSEPTATRSRGAHKPAGFFGRIKNAFGGTGPEVMAVPNVDDDGEEQQWEEDLFDADIGSAPMAMSAAPGAMNAAPETDVDPYAIVEQEVDMVQAKRMVKKSMAKNAAKFN